MQRKRESKCLALRLVLVQWQNLFRSTAFPYRLRHGPVESAIQVKLNVDSLVNAHYVYFRISGVVVFEEIFGELVHLWR